jgi:Flp pilus assembly protein TadD
MQNSDLNEATQLIRNGFYSDALVVLTRIIDQGSATPSVYQSRCLCRTTEGNENYLGALEDINQAINSDPTNAQNYMIRAQILDRLGRRSEGRLDLVTAVGIDPNYLSTLRGWDESEMI